MPSRRTVLPTVLVCALLALGVFGAASASASHGQTTFFEAPKLLLSPSTRAQTISELQHLGVHAIRVEMAWSEVAPGPESRTKPSFEASNPSSYNWGEYGELISEASRLHWKVLLTVTAPAPRWATSNKRAPYVMRPNKQDFKQFMTAVGRRFGSEVSLFGVWNEPNELGYLQPQFNNKGLPVAPIIYRGLFEAGYAGLRNAGLRHPKVLMGETAPGGFENVIKRPELRTVAGVSPLVFLRGALCLNGRYKRARHCKMLPAYGYGQHPYAQDTLGPFYKPKNPGNVTIGVLGRLVTALNRAGKAGAVRRGLPIFLTEFGVMSRPNLYFGVSPLKQAQYQAIAERIAWQNGRVAAFSQYLLRDDPSSEKDVSFQTGLEYANGKKKPLFYAFPVPLTVTRMKKGVALWGGVRLTSRPTKVTVLIQRRKGARYQRLAVVHTNKAGYWQLRSKAKGRLWRVRWTSPEGLTYEGPPIAAYPGP